MCGGKVNSYTESLALLAHAVADYDRTHAQLAAMNFQPLVIEEVRSENGTILRRRVRENPLHRRCERLTCLVVKLLAEFGMTPTSAPRVHAEPPNPTGSFEGFLSGRPH